MNAPTDSVDLEQLPELGDDTIARMERELFHSIRNERTHASTRAARRRRTVWLTTGAAAAVIVVAAVIAPSISGLVTGTSGGAVTDSAIAPAMPVEEFQSGADEGSRVDIEPLAADMTSATDGREIIATASATVEVEDTAAAAQAIGAAAVTRGGYVESMTLEGAGAVTQTPEDVMVDGGIVIDPWMPYPMSGNWITVRVPSDQLTATIAELAEFGDVKASSINRQDVTDQVVDLNARIDAAQASVDRLTELMSQTGSVGDLIAAEQALSERQAMLESYQQHLASLENQVALSSLTVTLTEPPEVVTADPAGFGDGVAAGWNWLVAAANGLVIALGFLLPWLAVAAIAWLIVWGIVRLVRRRNAARANEAMPRREARVVADETDAADSPADGRSADGRARE